MELLESNKLKFEESQELTRLRCDRQYPFMWRAWPLSKAFWKLNKHIEYKGCGLELPSYISTQAHTSWKFGAR